MTSPRILTNPTIVDCIHIRPETIGSFLPLSLTVVGSEQRRFLESALVWRVVWKKDPEQQAMNRLFYDGLGSYDGLEVIELALDDSY